jgi:hypothetical protein
MPLPFNSAMNARRRPVTRPQWARLISEGHWRGCLISEVIHPDVLPIESTTTTASCWPSGDRRGVSTFLALSRVAWLSGTDPSTPAVRRAAGRCGMKTSARLWTAEVGNAGLLVDRHAVEHSHRGAGHFEAGRD